MSSLHNTGTGAAAEAARARKLRRERSGRVMRHAILLA